MKVLEDIYEGPPTRVESLRGEMEYFSLRAGVH